MGVALSSLPVTKPCMLLPGQGSADASVRLAEKAGTAARVGPVFSDICLSHHCEGEGDATAPTIGSHIILVTQQQLYRRTDRNISVRCLACMVPHATFLPDLLSAQQSSQLVLIPIRSVPSTPVCVVMSDISSKTPQQRCCLGLLYYSQALQAEGRKPVRQSTVVVSTDQM